MNPRVWRYLLGGTLVGCVGHEAVQTLTICPSVASGREELHQLSPELHQPSPDQVSRYHLHCPDLTVSIPTGKTLLYGHWFDVKQLCIDRDEATRGLYSDCVLAGVCTEAAAPTYPPAPGWILDPACPPDLSKASRELPMICVNRSQASAFCNWRGGRLPKAEEWQIAAYGSQEDMQIATRVSWVESQDEWHVYTPIGTHPKDVSAAGIRDVYGVPLEWTSAPAEILGDEDTPPCAECTSYGGPPSILMGGIHEAQLAAEKIRNHVTGMRCAYSGG